LSLILAGLAPGLNNLHIWLKSRRLEPLGMIIIAFMAAGATASLISGSVFFALIKESFLTATFGLICLFSLAAERPLMFYINRQFVAGDDPEREEEWRALRAPNSISVPVCLRGDCSSLLTASPSLRFHLSGISDSAAWSRSCAMQLPSS
jgi:hypothetical protein